MTPARVSSFGIGHLNTLAPGRPEAGTQDILSVFPIVQTNKRIREFRAGFCADIGHVMNMAAHDAVHINGLINNKETCKGNGRKCYQGRYLCKSTHYPLDSTKTMEYIAVDWHISAPGMYEFNTLPYIYAFTVISTKTSRCTIFNNRPNGFIRNARALSFMRACDRDIGNLCPYDPNPKRWVELYPQAHEYSTCNNRSNQKIAIDFHLIIFLGKKLVAPAEGIDPSKTLDASETADKQDDSHSYLQTNPMLDPTTSVVLQ